MSANSQILPPQVEAPLASAPEAVRLALPAWRLALFLLTLFAATLLAYSNSFAGGFPLDNSYQILRDPRITAATRDNVKLILTQDYAYPFVISGTYRPLTTLTYLFNYTILGSGGKYPAGYHWVNLMLHWLATALVFLFLLRVLREPALAFAAALLWALHPVSTECVTNIIGRSNLLAASAVLGGTLCHLKATSATGWRKAAWLLALMLIVTAGLFCKESAIVVVAVMALYDLAFWKEAKWRDRLFSYIALAPPLLLFWRVRATVYAKLPLPYMPFVDNPLFGASFWTARMTAMKAMFQYFSLLLFPRNLSCDYSYNQVPLVTWRFNTWEEDGKAVAGLAVCLLAAGAAIWCFRRSPRAFFLIAFFFATMAPTSNLIMLIGPTMAERFLYLPSIGFIGCMVVGLAWVWRRFAPQPAPRWLAWGVLAVVSVALGARTYARNFDWMDDYSLWSSAVKVTPNSFKVHSSLAFALMEKNPSPENLDLAVAEADRTLAILDVLPDEKNAASTYTAAASYYLLKAERLARRGTKGEFIPSAASLPWYRRSLQTLLRAEASDHVYNRQRREGEMARGTAATKIPDDGWPLLYRQLGVVYLRLNQPAQALPAFQYGLRLAPQTPEFYEGMAKAYASLGDNDRAAVALISGLLATPEHKRFNALLAEVYQRIDPHNCAFPEKGNEAVLNGDCPLAHQHLCMAYEGLVALLHQSRRDAAASQVELDATLKQGCPAEPLKRIFPEGVIF